MKVSGDCRRWIYTGLRCRLTAKGRECEFAGAGSLPFGCAMPPPSAIRTSLADAPGPRRSASDPGMQELRAPEPQRPRTTGAVVDPVAVKKTAHLVHKERRRAMYFRRECFRCPRDPDSIHPFTGNLVLPEPHMN
jgi:hypothetical protein